jgi:hypothetical protein
MCKQASLALAPGLQSESDCFVAAERRVLISSEAGSAGSNNDAMYYLMPDVVFDRVFDMSYVSIPSHGPSFVRRSLR